MSHNDLLSALSDELDDAYAVKVEEIQKLENFASLHQSDRNTDEIALGIFRKAQIMLLYAHFEGFCKFVLQCYVIYINKECVSIQDLKHGLLASCLEGAFNKLTDSQHKPVKIKAELKDDKVLQVLGRRREFLCAYNDTVKDIASINEDLCVDTESNLWAHTLKKLMYKLELTYDIVAEFQGDVNSLLHLRNAYAHGGRDKPPTEQEYTDYKKTVFMLMKRLRDEIQSSFSNRAYLTSPSYASAVVETSSEFVRAGE